MRGPSERLPMTDTRLEKPAREISDYEFHVATGNWRVFDLPLERVFEAADQWSTELQGIERPWLCWHVDKDWCLVQQRLVKAFDWTPLVGGDPRAGMPQLIEGAVYIDFNKSFGFRVMYPQFVMEFAFLLFDRLAFWHSDLLLREHKMERVTNLFASLEDGSMAAALDKGGFRNWLNFRQHRYWELLGCTTRSASKSLFDTGCGWWRHFREHPNCPNKNEYLNRSRYNWDHGTGVRYWEKHHKGRVVPIAPSFVEEGHFTRINAKSYKTFMSKKSQRDLSIELSENYDLAECCRVLSLEAYLG